jgi:hypothetical protein
MDLQDAIGNLRYYAGWADKWHGQTIEVDISNALPWLQLTSDVLRPSHKSSHIPATSLSELL